MNPALWRRAEDLFHAALDRSPEARRAFLDEACGEDVVLRRHVEMLVSKDEQAGSFLERPAARLRDVEALLAGRLSDDALAVTPPAPAPAPTLAVGQRLGPYEIECAIGAGGMGEVYKARDTQLLRAVAIKVLPAAVSADPQSRRRFEQEARAISALNHPHICVVHHVGRESGIDFLVMEYLEGQTLAERLRGGPLPLPQALEIGIQIAEALARAHHRGIVHRDLKPANVMLTRDGAKLLDFGLAKLRPAPAVPSAPVSAPAGVTTTPGVAPGTVPYMAPEQLEGQQTDARSDIFAFGCVLHELVTGRRAFAGDSDAGIVAAIMIGEVAPLGSVAPSTPPALARLVRRCLAKDPDARWQDASDVAEELRGITTDSIAPSKRVWHVDRRRGRWLAAAVALPLVAAAAWTAGSRLSRPSPEFRHVSLAMPVATTLSESISSVLAVAADGSGLVYLGRSGNDRQLYWHDLHATGSWPLAGTEGAHTPFLSPDGRWLGFFRDDRLIQVPLQGGQVVGGGARKEVRIGVNARGATWASDGTIVYGTLSGGLWRVPPEGGTSQPLTTPDRSKNEGSHRFPSFLPGGRSVLFTVQHTSWRQDRAAIAVVSLADGRVTTVRAGGVYARYLSTGHLVYGLHGTLFAVAFDPTTSTAAGSPTPVLHDVFYRAAADLFAFDITADGTLVYASEKADLRSNTLVWVTRDGAVQPALRDRRPYLEANLGVSPDGRRVAVAVRGRPHTNIWIGNLDDGNWQPLRVEADCYAPVWSPTGDRVAFASNLDGAANLYGMAANGEGPPERLGRSNLMQSPQSWSPDGRSLAFEVQQEGKPNEVRVLQMDGRAPASRWGPTETHVIQPAFSPDGRWIAYQSQESGRWEIWARPFPEPGPGQAPKERISGHDGGLGPSWLESEIYYVERVGDTRIMSRRVVSMSPLRLAAPTVAFSLPFALKNTDFRPRAFAVEPGGRRVLVAKPDERAPPFVTTLEVVPEWQTQVNAMLRARR